MIPTAALAFCLEALPRKENVRHCTLPKQEVDIRLWVDVLVTGETGTTLKNSFRNLLRCETMQLRLALEP